MSRRQILGLVATGAIVATLALPQGARAASEILYLEGNSVPSDLLTESAPTGGTLPNLDPDRDSDPGLLLETSASGVNETDPAKYQQWAYDVSGQRISVQNLVIWAAPRDFDRDKTVTFATYLMDCGSGCSLLDTATNTISNASTWKRTVVPVNFEPRDFETGHSIVVKIVVLDASEADMWFAYASANHDAHLRTIVSPQTPTTTTSSTSTTTATETTTTTTTTTTTIGVTTTTIAATSPPPSGDQGSTDPPTDPEPAESPRIVVFGPASAVDVGLFRDARDLTPQDGLGVAFTTLTENIELYWQVAVALGSVAAVLGWMGVARSDIPDDEASHARRRENEVPSRQH